LFPSRGGNASLLLVSGVKACLLPLKGCNVSMLLSSGVMVSMLLSSGVMDSICSSQVWYIVGSSPKTKQKYRCSEFSIILFLLEIIPKFFSMRLLVVTFLCSSLLIVTFLRSSLLIPVVIFLFSKSKLYITCKQIQ
jgi:hypothetical protein